MTETLKKKGCSPVSWVRRSLELPKDVNTALQTALIGMEAAMAFVALNSQDPEVRLAVGAVAGISSLAALWAIDRRNLTKTK